MAGYVRFGQIAALALLLALGVQSAFPHLHDASGHESEFCAGHLGAHGSVDDEHAGACPFCRIPPRTRLAVATASCAETSPASCARFHPRACVAPPPQATLASAGPRAPPAPPS